MTLSASPNEIIATETGPIKAAIILAALRAAGWEVVRSSGDGDWDKLSGDWERMFHATPAKKSKHTLPLPKWPRLFS